MAKNEIVLYGTVGGMGWWDEDYFTAGTVREQLEGRTGPLTVRINSGGGIASEGQAIYTMLRDYAEEHGEVHVIVDAVAMSAASLIVMAGDRRTMRLGSYLLIHDPASPWSDGRGTEEDHLKMAEHLRVISSAYAEVYAIRAGLDRKEARRIMREETVLDSEAAVLMGFATETEAAEAVPAAKFDYRIYAHAPAALREASRSLGAPQGRQAVMAMMAGISRPTQKEALMADDKKVAEGTSGDDTKKTPAKEPAREPEKAPNGAPLPERTVDPLAPPEEPAKVEAARRAERDRIKGIRDLVMMAKLPSEVADDLIDRDVKLEEARTQIVAKWKEDGDKDIPMYGRANSRIIADGRDRFAEGLEKGLMARIGLKGGERNEFTSMHSMELARTALSMAGIRLPATADKNQIAKAALTMVGQHTTGDFGNILGNVARKSMLNGWEEEDEQFTLLTGRARSLPDFRVSTMVGLGFFETLAEKPEGAEYKYGTFADRSRTIALLTYGKMFAITREAIINDELGILLDEVPRKMGRAARRTVGNLVWNILLANAGLGVTMPDGLTLFHATHGNVAAAGTALSVDSLGAALSAMRVQKSEGLTIGMRARYLIVPAALEMKAREIVNSTVYPGTNRGMQANPVAGSVEIIVDPRLDAVSTTAWYLMADPNVRDTIMLAYLDGADEPFMDEQGIWSTDGREWKVRIDAGVAPGDYQAFYRNAGA